MIKKIIGLIFCLCMLFSITAYASSTIDSLMQSSFPDALKSNYADDFQKTYDGRYDGEENVSTNSGQLSYQVTDLVLKGKNGHDFVLRRQFQNQRMPDLYAYYDKILTDPFENTIPAYPYYKTDPNGNKTYYYITFFNDSDMHDNAEISFKTNNQMLLDKSVSNFDFNQIPSGSYYFYYDIKDDVGAITLTRDTFAAPITCIYNTMGENLRRIQRYSTNIINYDIGCNWSFMLPSLYQSYGAVDYYKGKYTYENYGYFYDGEGSVYSASEQGSYYTDQGNWATNDMKIKNSSTPIPAYKCSFLKPYNYQIYNDSIAYNRTITDKNGKKMFFDYLGKIVAIDDRFGNRIKFIYNQSGISQVIDTYGRIINFAWSSSGLTVTVGDEVITYEVQTVGGQQVLTVKHNNQLETKYYHSVKTGSFVAQRNGLSRMFPNNYFSATITEVKQYKVYNIDKIIQPTGREIYFNYNSSYDYYNPESKVMVFKKYKVSERGDKVANDTYKKLTYSYGTNTATVVDVSNNLTQTDTYNTDNYLTNSVVSCQDGYKETKYEYSSYGGLTLVKTLTETDKNNKDSTAQIQKISQYDYDTKGNKTYEKIGDYSATYTYDPNYSIMLTKAYKRDANHEVFIKNSLHNNDKSIAWERIFERLYNNNVLAKTILKKETKYEYINQVQDLLDNVGDFESSETHLGIVNGWYGTDGNLRYSQDSAIKLKNSYSQKISVYSGSSSTLQTSTNSVIPGHKYLFTGYYYLTYKGGQISTKVVGYPDSSMTSVDLGTTYWEDTLNSWKQTGVLFTAIPTPNSINLIASYIDRHSCEVNLDDWQLIDLTALYTEGKEPTTLAEAMQGVASLKAEAANGNVGGLKAIHTWAGDNTEISTTNSDPNGAINDIINTARSSQYLNTEVVKKFDYTYYDVNNTSSNPQRKSLKLTTTTCGVNNLTDGQGNELAPKDVQTEDEYDLYDNQVSHKSGNSTINYQYDELNRLHLETYDNNSFKQYDYYLPANYVILTDENGNKQKQQYNQFNDIQTVSAFNIDKGRWDVLTEYTYDKTCKKNTETAYRQYDNNGQSIEKYVAKYEYYQDNKPKAAIVRKNDVNAGEIISQKSYTYDMAVNDTINGLADVYTKVTKTVTGDVTITPASSRQYFDRLGRLVKEEVSCNEAQTDGTKKPKTYTTTYKYDFIGNKIGVREPRAFDETWNITFGDNSSTTQYEYDFDNKVVKETNAKNQFISTVYDCLGRAIQKSDYKAQNTKYTYNNMNLLVQTEQPFIDGITSKAKFYYDENGNKTKELSQNNKDTETTEKYKTVQYRYDIQNRLKTVIQYESDSNSDVIPSYTQYAYDMAGRKTKMFAGLHAEINTDTETGADTDFAVTRYGYNYLNQMTSITDPRRKTTSYTYDLSGNVLTMEDRSGNTTNFSYNGLGKMLTKEVTKDGITDKIVNTYDILGNRLTMKTYKSGTETASSGYGYDDLGRLITETDPNGITKSYTYDAVNNRKTFALKKDGVAQTSLSYSYDQLNRLDLVKDELNGSITLADYDYDANGNREYLKYPTMNYMTHYAYNYANKLKALQNGVVSSYDGTNPENNYTRTDSNFTYDYYLNGNQASKTVGAVRTDYAYDGLGRLKSEAVGGVNTSYDYDDYSNRYHMTVTGGTSPFTTTYGYDKNNRLMTESKIVGDTTELTSYSYDENGNMTYKGKETTRPVIAGQQESYSMYVAGENPSKDACFYEYDGFNQLTKAIEGDKTINYAYSGDGLRTSKTVNGVTTNNIWDGQDIVAQMDGSNNITAKYIRGIGLIAADISGQSRSYYAFNGHGDVVQLLGMDGGLKKSYDYDAFSNEKNPDPTDVQPFRYAGEMFEPETGNYYLRARDYSPSIGRFTSEDPYWRDHDGITGASLKGDDAKDPLQLSGYTVDLVAATTKQIMKKQEAEKGKPDWLLEGEGDATARIIAHQQEELGQVDADKKKKMEQRIKDARLISMAAIIQSGNLYGYCGNNPIMFIDPNGLDWSEDMTIGDVLREMGLDGNSQEVKDALKQAGVSIWDSAKSFYYKTGGDPSIGPLFSLSMPPIFARCQGIQIIGKIKVLGAPGAGGFAWKIMNTIYKLLKN